MKDEEAGPEVEGLTEEDHALQHGLGTDVLNEQDALGLLLKLMSLPRSLARRVLPELVLTCYPLGDQLVRQTSHEQKLLGVEARVHRKVHALALLHDDLGLARGLAPRFARLCGPLPPLGIERRLHVDLNRLPAALRVLRGLELVLQFVVPLLLRA